MARTTTRELARRAQRAGEDLERGVTEAKMATLERQLNELEERVSRRPSRDPRVLHSLNGLHQSIRRMRGTEAV